MEDPNQATDWLLQLISVVPTDPHVLAKIGKLYDNEGDKSQAFHYYYEVLALYCFSNALCHNLKKNCHRFLYQAVNSFKLFKMS